MTHPLTTQAHSISASSLRKVAGRTCALLLLGSSALPLEAQAQGDRPGIGGARPEVHLSAGGHGDLGAGFRIDIPIVPSGFLASGRDELALSPGMDIQFFDLGPHDGGYLLLMPQLAVQWNFYFPRGWSIFPELGLAVVVGDDRYPDHNSGNVHVDPLLAFGARRHFNPRNALLLRAGWPNGFQVGITF